jgi:hypothetical protein
MPVVDPLEPEVANVPPLDFSEDSPMAMEPDAS